MCQRFSLRGGAGAVIPAHKTGTEFEMQSIAALLGGACLAIAIFDSAAAERPPRLGRTVALFDGKTLAGWEGSELWLGQAGVISGGSLTEPVKHNDFLASTRDYTNFVVRFQIRLLGTNGFLNSGFQIRSQRVPNNSEMAGYQCDYGEPAWVWLHLRRIAAQQSNRHLGHEDPAAGAESQCARLE